MAKSTTPATGSGRGRLTFCPHFRRQVIAQFNGGLMSSDGGALLLAEVERILYLFDRLAACFVDHHHPNSVVHSVRALLIQRIVSLVLVTKGSSSPADLTSSAPAKASRMPHTARGIKPLKGKARIHRKTLEIPAPDK